MFRQQGKSFLPKYEEFLRQSGSRSVEDVASKVLNINVRDPNFWSETIQALKEPMRTPVGGTLHGWISCGSYKVRLWTYTEIYGSGTKYKNAKTVVLLPESPEFVMAYGAVPMLSKELNAITQAEGARHLYEYLDPAKTAHYYGVKAAPIAVPVAVDKIYTVQVVA
jgi:hypothetical protein